jgi:ATP-dependent RNA helicase DDX54/DBP10
MPYRAVSPAVSENEFDITTSLFRDNAITQGGDIFGATAKGSTLDASCILDLGVESDGDGDEAFIAAQQAASNRKLKCKSVKKGGGFQAMGKLVPLYSFYLSPLTNDNRLECSFT